MKNTFSIGSKALAISLVACATIWLSVNHVGAFGPTAKSSAEVAGLPDPIVTPQDAKRIAKLSTSGLHRDRSDVGGLINSIGKSSPSIYKKSGMHSLARLGAIEATSAINDIANTNDLDIANYAKASKARLLAEAANRSLTGAQSTKAKLGSFYQELGETPEQINAAVAAHYNGGGASIGPQPVEVYALREVADIIYCDAENSNTVFIAPSVGTLDMQHDPPSALKLKVASLPAAARIPNLIQDLSQKKTLGMDDYFEMQLAADGGLAASSAAAAQLVQMEANKTQYAPEGFTALLQVIHAVGDKSQAALFARLMARANVEFMYPDVKNGVPQQIVPGY